jgi:hypothetical protein
MDTIHEIRRVIQVNLNYLDSSGVTSNQKEGPNLREVRDRINSCKRLSRFYYPFSIILGILAGIGAVTLTAGVEWIPWNVTGVLIIAAFLVIWQTISLESKLEQLKKKELFLYMLRTINK